MTVSMPARPGDTATADGHPVLRIAGLRVEFATSGGTVPAVRGVDLEIHRGETLAVLGESGSGKSVTARTVMGLAGASARVTADALELDGTDLLHADTRALGRLRGDTMSMVFQDAMSALNPVLSIGDQVGELFRVHRGMNRRAARAQVPDLLAAVGIPDPAARARDYPHQFSGGMRQRILIAMAIALEPTLLIADEPTTALDVTVQAQILDLLADLRDRLDLAMLLITHDLGVACEVADRVAVMYHGRIVETGSTGEILAAPGHPYTAALLESVPQSAEVEDLVVIPGSPPPPTTDIPGCAFAPRCSWVVPHCREARPPLLAIAPSGRAAACHRSEEVLRGGL